MNLRSGVKIYDNDWFIRYGWEPERLADFLSALNVSYVIAQSRYLPMDNSAVNSSVSEADQIRYAKLDDVMLRELLRERGVDYIAVENICFDPAYAAAHPEDLPLDQFGDRHEQVDWYIGIPPDRSRNIAAKAAKLKAAVQALEPDEIHLGFIRWPGFWETWLPGEDRKEKPEYCFAPQTIERFNAFAGLTLAPDRTLLNAQKIMADYRDAWTDFKCRATRDAIATIRSVVEEGRESIPVSINTVPLFDDEFENAAKEVFGQDWNLLGEVVDTFEVMSYHQIMKRDTQWPKDVGEHIRAISGCAAISTIQVSPLYLEGMHKERGRSTTLNSDEFCDMLNALETAEVDGVCIFTLTEMMDRMETEDGRRMLERLGRFRR